MNPPVAHGSARDCPCMVCRIYRSKQTMEARRNRKIGKPNMVPVERALEHIQYLRGLGMNHKLVAEVAGLNPSTTNRMLFPVNGRRTTKIRRETESAILAVKFDLDKIPDMANVLAVGTHRRVQALVAIGWSLPRLAEQLGMDNSHLQILDRKYVLARKARAVRSVYNRLWDKQPKLTTRFERAAYSKTINWAKRQEFLPPAAWDDDTIDDPGATPDLGEGDGSRRQKAPLDEVLFFASFGLSLEKLATKFGVSEGYIRERLKEAA
jgi:hypothetical protein